MYYPNDFKCDDGVECTFDLCEPEGCAIYPVSELCEVDGNECATFECELGIGCTGTPDVTQCDDGVECTVEDCDAVTGLCSSLPTAELCEDGTECRVANCDAELGCLNDPDDALCDDGISCSGFLLWRNGRMQIRPRS